VRLLRVTLSLIEWSACEISGSPLALIILVAGASFSLYVALSDLSFLAVTACLAFGSPQSVI